MQIMHPGLKSAAESFSILAGGWGCSSPGWLNVPSPLISPYRPAPTSITSCADAFSIAWLIERHGVAFAPQVLLSDPSLATNRVLAKAPDAATDATAKRPL